MPTEGKRSEPVRDSATEKKFSCKSPIMRSCLWQFLVLLLGS